jgi:hypothetical protein
MDPGWKCRRAMKKSVLQPYLQNVRNSVFRNVLGFLEHVEEKKEDEGAEIFLLAIIEYCEKLLDDPSKRKKKRKRTRHGSGNSAKIGQVE